MQTVALDTPQFSLQAGAEGVCLARVGELAASLLRSPCPFCRLSDGQQPYVLQSVSKPAGASLQTRWQAPAGGGELRLNLRASPDALVWEIDLVTGPAQPVWIAFPFLEALYANPSAESPTRGAREVDALGRPIFRFADWLLPLTRRLGARSLTFLSDSPAPSGGQPAEAYWPAEGLRFEHDARTGHIFRGELIFHAGGWPEAFDLFRQKVRAGFDFSQYQRADTAWFAGQLVQHFTFLFGGEILNLESGEFEPGRLLQTGEQEFGGFDGLLAWGAYPRLGVDERTQWDFADDLPGGRAGLRALGQQARAQGTRLFLPYLPWDHSAGRHGRSEPADADALARLVAECDADGIFLDTLAGIGAEFREAVDRRKPGVVFCSEGHVRRESLELVTGSWSETSLVNIRQGNWSPSPERLPEVDLYRFLFPEHRMFFGNRHATAADRLRMIQRGFFNASGWMVWQDVFGLMLPYSAEASRLLGRCRRILRENRSAVQSRTPTPILDTLAGGVYANLFPGQAKRLWTLYNENATVTQGPLLAIEPRLGCHYVDVFQQVPVTLDEQQRVRLAIPPQAVSAIVELPRVLELTGDHLVIHQAPPGATLELCAGPETVTCPVMGDRISSGQLGAAGLRARWLRLMAQGELVDMLRLDAPETGGGL